MKKSGKRKMVPLTGEEVALARYRESAGASSGAGPAYVLTQQANDLYPSTTAPLSPACNHPVTKPGPARGEPGMTATSSHRLDGRVAYKRQKETVHEQI